jgi:colicin import membrane protein/protein TonB
VASALSRRERLWPAVSASVVAHVVLIAWGVAHRPPPPIDLEQKAIVAKLVRLGEKRPEQYLPRKDAAPPPAAPAPAAAAPAAPVPPRPATPAPHAKPAPAPAAAAAPPAAQPGSTSLSSILSKVQRQADEERWGDPTGSSAGDSDTAEGDQYLALVDRALRANYVVPVTIPDRERLYLEANIILWVEPDGRIVRWRQERPSGNPTFDAAVQRTLKVTPRVPAPPRSLSDSYRKTGIQLVFRARAT